LHYFARLREQHPSFFQRLTLSTAGLRYLIAVFTHSHFLAEEILEHPVGPSNFWKQAICTKCSQGRR